MALPVLALIWLAISIIQFCRTNKEDVEKWAQIDDLNGKTFVSIPGSDFNRLINERFPDSRIIYVQDWADQDISIIQGKADAEVCEQSSAKEIIKTYPDLCIMPEAIGRLDSRWCTSKTSFGNRVAKEFNTYLAMLRKDGTLDRIYETWEDPDNAPDHVDMPAMTGEPKGKLTIVTSLDWIPMCYRKGDQACGFFIDLCYRFCAWAGYEPDFEYVNIESALAGFNSGKYDLLAYGTEYREEATDRMNFTDTIYDEPIYVMIRKDLRNGPGILLHPMDFLERKLGLSERHDPFKGLYVLLAVFVIGASVLPVGLRGNQRPVLIVTDRLFREPGGGNDIFHFHGNLASLALLYTLQ